MKLRGILAAIAVIACGGMFAQNQNCLVVDFEPGDSRVNWEEPRLLYGEKTRNAKVAEYENSRERHGLFIAALGPDKDWEADVIKAKEEGGHVVEAVITPGELAELCMSPADAANVTHLKLTGRAFKWQVYGPDSEDLKLGEFLLRMPKLKVLNLRDLDCELFRVNGPKTLQKIVMPANCTSTQFTYIPPKIVYPSNRLLCIGEHSVENGKRVLSMSMFGGGFNTANLKEVEFPEGLLYIAELWVREDCQKIVFPSTLKRIESFGRAGSYGDVTAFQIKNLREVHLKSATPPELGHFDYKYEHLINATLYVPKGSKSAYMKHLKWRQFGNIVEEDVVIGLQKVIPYLSYQNLIQGKWTLEKEELYDPAGIFNGVERAPRLWAEFSDGKFKEAYNVKGKEVVNNTPYKVEGDKLIVTVPNGTLTYTIENLTLDENIISVGVNNEKQNYKLTLHYKRAKE